MFQDGLVYSRGIYIFFVNCLISAELNLHYFVKMTNFNEPIKTL